MESACNKSKYITITWEQYIISYYKKISRTKNEAVDSAIDLSAPKNSPEDVNSEFNGFYEGNIDDNSNGEMEKARHIKSESPPQFPAPISFSGLKTSLPPKSKSIASTSINENGVAKDSINLSDNSSLAPEMMTDDKNHVPMHENQNKNGIMEIDDIAFQSDLKERNLNEWDQIPLNSTNSNIDLLELRGSRPDSIPTPPPPPPLPPMDYDILKPKKLKRIHWESINDGLAGTLWEKDTIMLTPLQMENVKQLFNSKKISKKSTKDSLKRVSNGDWTYIDARKAKCFGKNRTVPFLFEKKNYNSKSFQGLFPPLKFKLITLTCSHPLSLFFLLKFIFIIFFKKKKFYIEVVD